jgi:hypothetical protein
MSCTSAYRSVSHVKPVCSLLQLASVLNKCTVFSCLLDKCLRRKSLRTNVCIENHLGQMSNAGVEPANCPKKQTNVRAGNLRGQWSEPESAMRRPTLNPEAANVPGQE